jgi:hypothetical protein
MNTDETPDVDSVAPESAAPVERSEPAPQSAPVSTPWDSFKQLPEFQGQDDRAIASRLYQSMQREQAATRALQQYQQVMPIAQEYLSNRPEFEKWRQQQQAQQEPAKPKWWNPPEVKDSYRRYLTKDEHGREIVSPDAPLDARHALLEYQNYRADFAQKFLSNPEEALGPMVAELAQKQAQEMIERQLQERDNQDFVANFEKENADWLLDEQGSVSPQGVRFHKYVEEAREYGFPPGKPRAEYAVKMTELELLREKYEREQQGQPQGQPQMRMPEPVVPPVQQSQPQPDLARQNMEYLRREASRNPSRSAGAANNDPRQPKPKRTFEQMLMDEASSKSLI